MDAPPRVTADDRLRALERRWRETGDRADEGALLLERVRLGLLDRTQLELAAFCAHEGARRALGETAWPPDLRETLAGLERWGPAAVSTATGALLQALRDAQVEPGKGTPVLEAALGSVEARTLLRYVRAALIELALGA